MEDDSDSSMSTQILGDWDFSPSPSRPPPPPPPPVKDTGKERGASTSCVPGGRVLPAWADPSYEWGGGKWKIDGRTNRKNKNKNMNMNKAKEKEKEKESDLSIKDLMNKGKEKDSDLSIEDLMNEYSSLPTHIAEWYWCIEYVAKFKKDLRCILDVMNMGYPCTRDSGSRIIKLDRVSDVMNMGYPCTVDFGSRINEVVSLRILEFLFDPTKTDAPMVGPGIEFDFSLSSTHVLNTILEQITVSEIRPGMPELSKFNLLPFIAHKNKSLPLCALEMLSAMENNSTSEAEPNDPVYHRDDQPEQMEAHTGLEQTNMNDKDNVVEGNDQVQTNEGDEVIVIDGNETTSPEQPLINNNNGNTTMETSSPSSDVRVKCTKDGVWLICGSSDDDESDIVKAPPRPGNVCWKCQREGGALLLTCSRSDCGAKVHKECLNCPANFDENDNFHCPLCWYDRIITEYIDSQKLKRCAIRRVEKFSPVLHRASKRLRVEMMEGAVIT